jgi:hypothetical protein
MMKKILFHFFFIALITVDAYAQQFQRLYGGPSQEISLVALPAPTGGIYFLGATTSAGSGSADPSLMKLDDDGQVLWARTIGEAYYDVAGAMTIAADGGLVCAGSTKSFNGNAPDDLYFFKVDSMGGMVWSKTFSAGELDVATAVLTTADGGFAITGFTIINTVRHVLLIRTDANGDTLFTRVYVGAGHEQGVEFFETADGGFVITGKTFPQLPGESDIFLMRTDALGNVLWAKSYGESLWDEGAGIIRLADGNFLLSGSTISFGQGDFDVLLMKTDSSGNILWGKTYGGPKIDASYTARENSDGSIVVSGYTNSLGYGHNLRMINPEKLQGRDRGDDSTNVFLMKVNADGDTVWTRTYGDGAQDEAFHFSKMPDGGYLLPGVSTSYTNTTDSTQMLIVRTDSSGHSGCHEQDGHPIIDTTNFITQTLNFTFTSGLTEAVVTSISLAWNESAEDACLYTGVNEITTDAIDVYPNPASGIVNIVNRNSGIDKIEMYNLLGESIFTKTFSLPSLETSIDVSGYLPGIYFITVSTASSSTTKKVIIQKN